MLVGTFVVGSFEVGEFVGMLFGTFEGNCVAEELLVGTSLLLLVGAFEEGSIVVGEFVFGKLLVGTFVAGNTAVGKVVEGIAEGAIVGVAITKGVQVTAIKKCNSVCIRYKNNLFRC